MDFDSYVSFIIFQLDTIDICIILETVLYETCDPETENHKTNGDPGGPEAGE